MHDAGEKVVLGHVIKAGGGESDGEQVLDILARASVDGALHRDEAGAPVRQRHAAAGARRSRGGAVPRDRRRPARGDADDPDVAGVPVARRVSREGQDAVRVRRQRAARDRRRGPATRGRSCASMQQLGMPLYQCQPPTGYKDTADAWVNTGALVSRMNFALRSRAASCAARRSTDVDRRRRSCSATCRTRRARRSRRRRRAADDGADARLAGIPDGGQIDACPDESS